MRVFTAIPGASSAQTLLSRRWCSICVMVAVKASAVEQAPLCSVLCSHGRAACSGYFVGDLSVTFSFYGRRQKKRMRKHHPLCHQGQQIWAKSCARTPARISQSTVKVWMLVETMRSCQSPLTTVTVPVEVLTMRSCQPPWESWMPSMTMEEMEVRTMRTSFLRSPTRASCLLVSTNGRAHVWGSLYLSANHTGCMGQTPEGICILKSPVARVAAHDDAAWDAGLGSKYLCWSSAWAGGPESSKEADLD